MGVILSWLRDLETYYPFAMGGLDKGLALRMCVVFGKVFDVRASGSVLQTSQIPNYVLLIQIMAWRSPTVGEARPKRIALLSQKC